MTSPHQWTATRALAEIAAGTLSRAEYLDACLARVAACEPEIGAWTHLNELPARERARALDQAPAPGPLSGIPFGVKDIIDTVDMPTELGSPIYAGHRPAFDAACVALARKAGGIALGKTVTTEFANVHPGKTRNPFDPARTPGGSSSGSAAAVGAGMVPLAIGTQTTASTIRPASYCGTYGFIPTSGLLSCSGVRQSSWTLDRLGLFARSIADIALFNDVLRGDSPTPLEASRRPPRIAFCRTHLWDRLEPTTAVMIEATAGDLRKAGADVVDLDLPAVFEDTASVHRWISSYEFTRNYTHEIEHHFDRISPALRNGRIADGLSCSFERYDGAIATAMQAQGVFDALSSEFDVVLTASASGEAPHGKATGDYAFCALWTALQVPCITVPALTGPSGLPVGVQFVGRRRADVEMLRAVQWISQALGIG